MSTATKERARCKVRGRPGRHLTPDELGSNTRMVFVIGLDYDVKHEITWIQAVEGRLEGTYDKFRDHDTKRVRSAGGTVDMGWPLIVRLNYWVDIPFRKAPDLNTKASSEDVLRRDGWTCGYCGKFADTVDHIEPESRGGPWTWGNLIAACWTCNGAKGARTPGEAGMRMLWDPRVSTAEYAGVQATVWRILQDS